MSGGSGVATLAFDAGGEDLEAFAYRGVAAQTGAQSCFRLRDANRGGGRGGDTGPVAEREIEAAGLRVVADAMFEPPPIEKRERRQALISGAEDPIDPRAGLSIAALCGYFETLSHSRVREQESAARLADRGVRERLRELRGQDRAERSGVVAACVRGGLSGMAGRAGIGSPRRAGHRQYYNANCVDSRHLAVDVGRD
jgi:hypothetical protein